jgi:hypothetical protein
MLHKNAPLGDMHPIHNWEVADAAALAALVVTASDIGKVARQLDTEAYYILTDDSPLTWIALLASSGVALSDINVFTKNQSVAPVALTDAASIAVDASLSNNFKVTLAGNRTLANPTNLTDGMVLNVVIKQDATGSRTLAYGSKWDFGGAGSPTLSTAANSIDFISAYYDSASDKLLASFRKGT